jgi:hypothetical protein
MRWLFCSSSKVCAQLSSSAILVNITIIIVIISIIITMTMIFTVVISVERVWLSHIPHRGRPTLWPKFDRLAHQSVRERQLIRWITTGSYVIISYICVPQRPAIRYIRYATIIIYSIHQPHLPSPSAGLLWLLGAFSRREFGFVKVRT